MTQKEYNLCVEKFSDHIYRFMLKMTGNVADAEDLTQDTFAILWIHRRKIAGDKAKSYLFTTAYRRFIDKVRHDKYLTLSDTLPETSVYHEYSDAKEILSSILDRLPHNQKSAVLLRDYEGYSYDEIAQILDLTLPQVKILIFRARVAIKDYVKNFQNVV